MNLAEFSKKREELEEKRKELEARLAELVSSSDSGGIEEKRKIHGELAVLHMQISALEKIGSLYGDVAGVVESLPSIDELMIGANDLVAGMFKEGKSFFRGIKDRLNSALGGEEIAEEKKNHFKAVISLIKAGRKDSARSEIRTLESETGLTTVDEQRLEHTLNAVENLVKADREDAAFAVLSQLYA